MKCSDVPFPGLVRRTKLKNKNNFNINLMLLKLINLGPFKTFNRLIPSGKKKKKKGLQTLFFIICKFSLQVHLCSLLQQHINSRKAFEVYHFFYEEVLKRTHLYVILIVFFLIFWWQFCVLLAKCFVLFLFKGLRQPNFTLHFTSTPVIISGYVREKQSKKDLPDVTKYFTFNH